MDEEPSFIFVLKRTPNFLRMLYNKLFPDNYYWEKSVNDIIRQLLKT